MLFTKKHPIPLLLLLVLLFLPFVHALTITDTTFQTSVSNFSIFVDSITLDNVTITNTTIQFFNLTSVGSNFTNVNDSFDATANFIGLEVNLTIRNVNTSTDLFTSSVGSQNFNATFTPGQVLRIILTVVVAETSLTSACNSLLESFGVLASFIAIVFLAVIGGVLMFFIKGSGSVDLSQVSLIQIGIGVLGLALTIVVGILIVSGVCAAT